MIFYNKSEQINLYYLEINIEYVIAIYGHNQPSWLLHNYPNTIFLIID